MTTSRLDLSTIRRRVGDLEKLILIGDADLATVSQLRTALRLAVDDADVRVIVDVSMLGTLDHVVLGELLGARMRASARHISMTIVCEDDRVFEWLERSGLTLVLPVTRAADAS